MAPSTTTRPAGSVACLVEPGDAAAGKPTRWLCVVWSNGVTVFNPSLRSNVPDYVPSRDDMLTHFAKFPDRWCHYVST